MEKSSNSVEVFDARENNLKTSGSKTGECFMAMDRNGGVGSGTVTVKGGTVKTN